MYESENSFSLELKIHCISRELSTNSLIINARKIFSLIVSLICIELPKHKVVEHERAQKTSFAFKAKGQ